MKNTLVKSSGPAKCYPKKGKFMKSSKKVCPKYVNTYNTFLSVALDTCRPVSGGAVELVVTNPDDGHCAALSWSHRSMLRQKAMFHVQNVLQHTCSP